MFKKQFRIYINEYLYDDEMRILDRYSVRSKQLFTYFGAQIEMLKKGLHMMNNGYTKYNRPIWSLHFVKKCNYSIVIDGEEHIGTEVSIFMRMSYEE